MLIFEGNPVNKKHWFYSYVKFLLLYAEFFRDFLYHPLRMDSKQELHIWDEDLHKLYNFFSNACVYWFEITFKHYKRHISFWSCLICVVFEFKIFWNKYSQIRFEFSFYKRYSFIFSLIDHRVVITVIFLSDMHYFAHFYIQPQEPANFYEKGIKQLPWTKNSKKYRARGYTNVYNSTNTWFMWLNIEMFKIIHIGKKNNCYNYTMSN